MIVLAIDTVSRDGGIALTQGNDDFISADLGHRGRHAEAIVPTTLKLLEQAEISWEDVELVAVNTGPGSFTGIRVGIAFVLGLCEAREIPAVGVGCLDILARACYDATSPEIGGYIVSTSDVRRGEVALARYRITESGPEREGVEELAAVSAPGPAPASPVICAGDGSTLLWPEDKMIQRWDGSGECRAKAVLHLGITAFVSGTHEPPVPRYARDADARPRRS